MNAPAAFRRRNRARTTPMSTPRDDEKLRALAGEVASLRQSARDLEGEFTEHWSSLDPDTCRSAQNLLHYLALRHRDNRALQRRLAVHGLSSLGRAEAHVLPTLDAVLAVLRRLIGEVGEPEAEGADQAGFEEGRRVLERRTAALLGPGHGAGGGRAARIMVTMPGDAAQSPELIRALVESGMDCMRINCAHDDRNAWTRMLEHLERAKRETGRDCRVLLDLAGPKLRTGAVEPGPRVIHWQPELNALGEVEAPALVWLTPATNPELPPLGASAVLPLDPPWLARLSPGDVLTFVDLRGEPGELLVREAETSARSRWAESTRTAYVGHDTTLIARSGPGKSTKPPFEATRPWAIAPREQGIQLQPGDTLILSRSQEPGQPVLRGPDGKLVAEPRIPCTLPEVFPFVKPGERIWFDDGKFGGVVAAAGPDELRIQITRSPLAGKKLRADKGINLPDSRFDLPALTPKDLEDLDFAVERADIIGLSFVNRPEDVEELARQIAQRTSRPLGIILKIETRRAFQELPRILLAGLKTPRVGVMIARGDLAVECGYERLAEIQEEILWLCEAAHVPAIWATQVLESMNKKGYPTRAEVTDAAMGERAECVMLNKGPHVCDAMRVLDDILGRMEAHQDKKSSLLRPLSISQIHASPANHFRASGS